MSRLAILCAKLKARPTVRILGNTVVPLQVVTNDQQDWSPAFRGICLYFQRLARPLDEVNLFRAIGAVPSGKAPLQLEVGLSLGAIQVSCAQGCAAQQAGQQGILLCVPVSIIISWQRLRSRE